MTYREQQVESLEKKLRKELLKNSLHTDNPFSMIGHRFLLKSFYRHSVVGTSSEFQNMLRAIR
jgi:hypothetical protein